MIFSSSLSKINSCSSFELFILSLSLEIKLHILLLLEEVFNCFLLISIISFKFEQLFNFSCDLKDKFTKLDKVSSFFLLSNSFKSSLLSIKKNFL